MNRCGYNHQQQNPLVGLGEMRRADGFSSFSMGMMTTNSNGVVCPKPRRLVNSNNNDPICFRPSRLLHTNNQPMEGGDSKAGKELLDIILSKGDHGAEKPNFQVACSPPFFNGSPPIRASNPVIQDEQFGNCKLSPLSPSVAAMDSPSSSRKNGNGGGCVRMKFGHSPAPVRIEGFNCRRNCSISAVA